MYENIVAGTIAGWLNDFLRDGTETKYILCLDQNGNYRAAMIVTIGHGFDLSAWRSSASVCVDRTAARVPRRNWRVVPECSNRTRVADGKCDGLGSLLPRYLLSRVPRVADASFLCAALQRFNALSSGKMAVSSLGNDTWPARIDRKQETSLC